MGNEEDSSDGSTAIPWRRDPDRIRSGLAAWAEVAVDGARILDVGVPESGMANESAVFVLDRGAGPEQFVARMAPLPESLCPTFPVYDLERQRRCLTLVAEATDVPVPTAPWVESDSAWLGSPFLVLSFIHGTVPSDNPPYLFSGWLLDADPGQRRRLRDTTADVLARIHRITPTTHDLSFLGQDVWGDDPLGQQLAYQRWLYDWAREGRCYPLVERALDRVAATVPEATASVLNWGDSRIGNILYDRFEPVGVLDWEMAAIGPPEVDLAWLVFFHRMFQEMAERYEFPGLPDLLDRADVVAAYEQASGRRLEDLAWYELFAAARFAVLSIRTGLRSVAYGQAKFPDDPDDLLLFRPLLEQMLDES